jgi:hypothetical protein
MMTRIPRRDEMSGSERARNRLISGFCLLSLLTLLPGRASDQAPLRAGQEALGTWWMRQTMLTPDGQFASLKTRRWWKRALALKPGESMILDVGGEAKDRMLVKRETVTLHGQSVDTIIWVIDDDGDGSALSGGDRDSDCYVIDYGADGTVDRMVDYIDNNGDGLADEMDVRFFVDGVLSYSWFGVDVDRDGVLWNIPAFDEGLEGCRTCDPNGDNLFYVNKFDPERGTWTPLGECPLAYYDTDGDGSSEVAVRISAVPASWDPAKDPDFASGGYARSWDRAFADAIITNIRSSYDVDGESGKEAPFHYEMSFNLVGRMPYKFPDMARTNPQRRPPQETVVIPWKDARELAETYPARETGFSWIENGDEATAPASSENTMNDPSRKGLAWAWERRLMENSGGPSRKWNVRREWSSKPSAKRELYYSDVDKRIHLFGAAEGWVQVGNFAGLGAVGEIRMFDTDGNGYFDRWEFYLSNSARPVRVTQVADEKARPIDSAPGALADLYSHEILPRAEAENGKILAAMNAVHPFEAPAELRAALTQGSKGYRRYAQDVLRELTYVGFRDYYSTLANQTLLKDSREAREGEFWGDLGIRAKIRKAEAETGLDSSAAWKLTRFLEELDIAYGRAEYDRACGLIFEIGRLGAGR